MEQRGKFLKILVIGVIAVVSIYLTINLKLNISKIQTLFSRKISQEQETILTKEPSSETKINEVPLKQVIIEGTLEQGDSFYSSLRRQGISSEEIYKIEKTLSSMINVRSLPVKSKYRLVHNLQGKFIEFIYNPNPIDTYIVSSSPSGELKVYKKEPNLKIVKIEGQIDDSLYNAMLKAKKSPELAVKFANIFSWQIDFSVEPRKGDIFKIIVEEEEQNNFSRPLRILAAQYEGKFTGEHTAIFFKDSNGHTDYYTAEGKSLRKAFLRAPLQYKYISSHFSYHRLHPILRVWRPHLGIDYAAPIGTPVVTIADGLVTIVSWDNDCGRYIKIKHLNGYESIYAHLYRYAKGIKKGVRVHQGQIIGYVGSSGLSTGPHLYFAISKNGKRINFLKMNMPSASSINPKYLPQFKEIKREYLSLLDQEEVGDESSLSCSVGVNSPLSLILPLQGGGNRWGYIPQQRNALSR